MKNEGCTRTQAVLSVEAEPGVNNGELNVFKGKTKTSICLLCYKSKINWFVAWEEAEKEHLKGLMQQSRTLRSEGVASVDAGEPRSMCSDERIMKKKKIILKKDSNLYL